MNASTAIVEHSVVPVAGNLAAALSRAQAEMPNAQLNKVNPHFRSKYADLTAIREATLPSLTKHGLAIYQRMLIGTDNCLVLVTTIAHPCGDFIESHYLIPFSDKPHVMGSAIAYARRYSWAALCGVTSEEDDDANAAQEGAKAGTGRAAPKRTRTEISAAADHKRAEHKRVQDDVNQITSFVELDRYKREVLTPDFMATLGNGQYAVEEMFTRREAELQAQQEADPAEEEVDEPTPIQVHDFTESKEWLQGAKDMADLEKRGKNEGYVTAIKTLTVKQRNDLRGIYKGLLKDFAPNILAAG